MASHIRYLASRKLDFTKNLILPKTRPYQNIEPNNIFDEISSTLVVVVTRNVVVITPLLSHVTLMTMRKIVVVVITL